MRTQFTGLEMVAELGEGQQRARAEFREFVEREVAPHADRYDREELLPAELLAKVAGQGYWGAALPREAGGLGMDAVTYGLLCEEFGRGCSSLRSLLTVHNMVSQAVHRWGDGEQKRHWLPRFASGTTLAALALTEPDAGSDPAGVQTSARPDGRHFLLDGVKRWITGGQIAGLFLLLARCDDRLCAFLVERDTPGLEVKPIFGMLGTRASMLAELRLEGCRVGRENLVGRVGIGFSHVFSVALDHGRYSVACGCVGIGQACLEASLGYAEGRRQFGGYLKEHQLIKQMITDMVTEVKAARLLCLHAGRLRDRRDPQAIMETCAAKYFASRMATRAAADAVQIHGANGCSGDYPVQRFLRDAKIMEIIEGSTQIQQTTIARLAYGEFASAPS